MLIACLIALLASVSATAGALIAAHFDRVYTGALIGLLFGPLGILFVLCAAGAVTLNPKDPKWSANVGFAFGPVGLAVAWYMSPGQR